MKKKDWTTAADLIAELNSDPDYLARKKKNEDVHKKLLAKRINEAAPVVAALRAAGVEVESIWELSEGGKSYPGAPSILLNQLKEDYPDHVREDILRALGTPDARSHWDELVEIFEHNTADLSPAIHYVAALALDGAFSEEKIDDVLRLAKDQRLGDSRVPLLLTLKRTKDPRAKMLLLELRTDPSIGSEVKRMRRLDRK